MFGFPFPCKMRIDSGDECFSFVLLSCKCCKIDWCCRAWSSFLHCSSTVTVKQFKLVPVAQLQFCHSVLCCSSLVSFASTVYPKNVFPFIFTFVTFARSQCRPNYRTYKGQFHKKGSTFMGCTYYCTFCSPGLLPLLLKMPKLYECKGEESVSEQKDLTGQSISHFCQS